MSASNYENDLIKLQEQLVAAQASAIEKGLKTLILFEGRDAAGKDGAIKRITEYMAPRQTRIVALPKPTERETSQWYFQRYTPHLPAAGETVFFNRSWYNRAGVEPVMGFCTTQQHKQFLNDAPQFERMLVQSGITLIKLWLDISQDEQAQRLEERLNDPLKRFKVSSLDAEAQSRWGAYTKARDQMLKRTDSEEAPWMVVATNKKKLARLNIMRHILTTLKTPDQKVEAPDPDILFAAKGSKGRLFP